MRIDHFLQNPFKLMDITLQKIHLFICNIFIDRSMIKYMVHPRTGFCALLQKTDFSSTEISPVH
jgi:hypothetical protein